MSSTLACEGLYEIYLDTVKHSTGYYGPDAQARSEIKAICFDESKLTIDKFPMIENYDLFDSDYGPWVGLQKCVGAPRRPCWGNK